MPIAVSHGTPYLAATSVMSDGLVAPMVVRREHIRNPAFELFRLLLHLQPVGYETHILPNEKSGARRAGLAEICTHANVSEA